MALLTGMRNGELYALRFSDLDFENRLYLRLHISIDHLTGQPRWIATMLDIPTQPFDKHHIRVDYVPTKPHLGLERVSEWIEACGVHIPSNWMETALMGSEAIEFYQSLFRVQRTDDVA